MKLGDNILLAATLILAFLAICGGSKSDRRPTSQRRRTSAAGSGGHHKSLRSRLGLGAGSSDARLWKEKCEANIKFVIVDQTSGNPVSEYPVKLDIAALQNLEQVYNEALKAVREQLPGFLTPDKIQGRVGSDSSSFEVTDLKGKGVMEMICVHAAILSFGLKTEELKVCVNVKIEDNAGSHLYFTVRRTFIPGTKLTLAEYVEECVHSAVARAGNRINQRVQYVGRLFCMHDDKDDPLPYPIVSRHHEARVVDLLGKALPYFQRFAPNVICELRVKEKDFNLREADVKVHSLGQVTSHVCKMELKSGLYTREIIEFACRRYLDSAGVLSAHKFKLAKDNITVLDPESKASRAVKDGEELTRAVRDQRLRPQLEIARTVCVKLHKDDNEKSAPVFRDSTLLDVYSAAGFRLSAGKTVRKDKVQLRSSTELLARKVAEFENLMEKPFSKLVDLPDACFIFYAEKI